MRTCIVAPTYMRLHRLISGSFSATEPAMGHGTPFDKYFRVTRDGEEVDFVPFWANPTGRSYHRIVTHGYADEVLRHGVVAEDHFRGRFATLLAPGGTIEHV